MKLSDLNPGTEFEYVDATRHYRKGKTIELSAETTANLKAELGI